jgi:hypothetical protein
MKTKFLIITCCMLLICYAIDSDGQANKKLSNLTSPTAVNQSLLPGADNTISLGGLRNRWNNLYLGNAIYVKGDITLHAPGSGNFFVGINAGNASLNGSNNTGIGQFSLFNLTFGTGNTANGCKALYNSTTGGDNTASGFQSLYSNSTGLFNTAHGVFSLSSNTTGSSNTAIGSQSLGHNTSGRNNTAVGAQADVSTGGLYNATAIGSNAIVDASDKVRLGDGSVKSIGGQVAWTNFSDGRYKKDIKENVIGLAFINCLRPITYAVNIQGLNEYYNKGKKQVEASRIVYSGFIGQEVEAAAKKLNYAFNGVDKPQTKDGLYGLRYSDFVVPLVKAVQELSKMNDELKSEIRNLKSEMDELKSITLSGIF